MVPGGQQLIPLLPLVDGGAVGTVLPWSHITFHRVWSRTGTGASAFVSKELINGPLPISVGYNDCSAGVASWGLNSAAGAVRPSFSGWKNDVVMSLYFYCETQSPDISDGTGTQSSRSIIPITESGGSILSNARKISFVIPGGARASNQGFSGVRGTPAPHSALGYNQWFYRPADWYNYEHGGSWTGPVVNPVNLSFPPSSAFPDVSPCQLIAASFLLPNREYAGQQDYPIVGPTNGFPWADTDIGTLRSDSVSATVTVRTHSTNQTPP